jgi:hypothetical protein
MTWLKPNQLLIYWKLISSTGFNAACHWCASDETLGASNHGQRSVWSLDHRSVAFAAGRSSIVNLQIRSITSERVGNPWLRSPWI